MPQSASVHIAATTKSARPPPPARRALGLTLLELLATLAIAAIVATMAVPALGALVRDMRITSLANTVLGSLQTARSEAIRRNDIVALCPSADGNGCDPTASYNDGWLIVSGDDPFAESAEILRSFDAKPEHIEIRLRFSSGFDGAMRYNARGMMQTPNGGRLAGSVWLCHEGTDRRVAVNFIGRPRLGHEPCRDD